MGTVTVPTVVTDEVGQVEWGHPNFIQAYPCGHQLLIWWNEFNSLWLPAIRTCPCCCEPLRMPEWVRRFTILAPDSGKRRKRP